eukprot:TRINITY_DN144_c0_g1_i1.p1 TRINITY_DN144_c0_g1~~TRINITY_DN144_c0_g1_i1.p1  ORF type:complete len:608 (-),score=243.40 TRINITY_DN144_c0_g1_i1:75-1898(-)
MENKSSKSDTPVNVFQKAMAQLQPSAIARLMPGREAEAKEIRQAMLDTIESKTGGALFISGLPGTGKTATVRHVLHSLRAARERAELKHEFDFIEINAMKLSEPSHAYKLVYFELTGQRRSPNDAQALLDAYFAEPKGGRAATIKPLLLLIDEIDYMVTAKQQVLYNFFNWTTRRHVPLLVMGISNTINLADEALQAKVASRMGQRRVTFTSYSREQLQAIISTRLDGLEAFEPSVVRLIAAKVASICGDARRALELCRTAARVAMHAPRNQRPQPPPPPPAAAVGGVAGAAADGGESWQLVHTLRGHLSDVYDIAWRADSGALCSGSTDNAVFVWDMARTSSGSKAATTKIEAHRLEGHTHFVQGVAWDPRGVFLCSAASDRTVRVYRRRTGGSDWHCSHVIAKLDAPRSMAIGLGKAVRLFADETININSFFRRLSWTPDGSLLLVPAGIAAVPAAAAAVASSAPPPHQHQQQQQQQQLHCVYVFARNALHRPLMRLAAAPKPFVCVRANPLCFEPRPGADRAGRWLQLAYRMVIAAATTDSVLLYETDSGGAPIALVKHAHYAELTDLAWSADGRQLVVSSKDGYCSLLTFDADELGRPSPLVL